MIADSLLSSLLGKNSNKNNHNTNKQQHEQRSTSYKKVCQPNNIIIKFFGNPEYNFV